MQVFTSFLLRFAVAKVETLAVEGTALDFAVLLGYGTESYYFSKTGLTT